MKLLAVCHPDRVLPAFPFTGDHGKARMLKELGLSVPPLSTSAGQRQIESNDALRQLTEPLFPGDAWAQGQFLYWLLDSDTQPETPAAELVDPLVEAAEDLLLDRAFLDDIKDLLQETKQVIFYGPPGTGKTFVAQRLAEALAGDPARTMLVQFHPSTSYEDFFEGFRPLPAADGGIAYALHDGPLRIMAAAAESDPSHTYVLVIDEINRAQLQKVLGELFFLLEYRDRQVRPLYRPDEPFSLPANLWLIGTMNTADRSIALVDAALRRRFQFVPFALDERADNPIAGLLRRWLRANSEPEWVADLVDQVNQELMTSLGWETWLWARATSWSRAWTRLACAVSGATASNPSSRTSSSESPRDRNPSGSTMFGTVSRLWAAPLQTSQTTAGPTLVMTALPGESVTGNDPPSHRTQGMGNAEMSASTTRMWPP